MRPLDDLATPHFDDPFHFFIWLSGARAFSLYLGFTMRVASSIRLLSGFGFHSV
jgi:hypothetical protein